MKKSSLSAQKRKRTVWWRISIWARFGAGLEARGGCAGNGMTYSVGVVQVQNPTPA